MVILFIFNDNDNIWKYLDVEKIFSKNTNQNKYVKLYINYI